ncbi:MAG: hypothetical protein H7Y17_00875 [Chlorobia bacterium]|nr:hypothetical protein [Fimbriimonadaceae bacterium]
MIAGIYRIISAVVALLLAMALLGCGSGFKWDGEWKGNRDLKVKPGDNPGIARTMGQVTLTIDSGAFKMSEAGVPYTGSVRIDGDKAFLKIETRMNIPIEKEPKEVQDQIKEIELTSRTDGKIDFYDPAGFFTEPVTIERQPAKT